MGNSFIIHININMINQWIETYEQNNREETNGNNLETMIYICTAILTQYLPLLLIATCHN